MLPEVDNTGNIRNNTHYLTGVVSVSVYTCIQMSCISVHMYPDVRYVILCFDCHAKLFSLAFSILYLISLYTYDRITYIK
jgi:hypothetical protein